MRTVSAAQRLTAPATLHSVFACNNSRCTSQERAHALTACKRRCLPWRQQAFAKRARATGRGQLRADVSEEPARVACQCDSGQAGSRAEGSFSRWGWALCKQAGDARPAGLTSGQVCARTAHIREAAGLSAANTYRPESWQVEKRRRRRVGPTLASFPNQCATQTRRRVLATAPGLSSLEFPWRPESSSRLARPTIVGSGLAT